MFLYFFFPFQQKVMALLVEIVSYFPHDILVIIKSIMTMLSFHIFLAW
jgi:hypothetical protein